MNMPPELGSEKFTRWAKAVWPTVVGITGCVIIFMDCVIDPPGDPQTSGVGIFLLSATGVVQYERFRRNGKNDG